METFDIICKENGIVVAYATWEDNEENRQRLEEWAEYGYEKTSDKYVQGYDGKWYVEGTEPEKPAPTAEEVQQARASAYEAEVDPITAHISRLRDEEATTSELEAEIRALIEERKTRVAEIKARYPYPEEAVSEMESVDIVD